MVLYVMVLHGILGHVGHENSFGRTLFSTGIAIDVMVAHHNFPRTLIDAAPPGTYETTNSARAVNCTAAHMAVSTVDCMTAEA